MDGRCVAEHENIIPDYSQHTPSYASPNAYNNQPIKYVNNNNNNNEKPKINYNNYKRNRSG